MQKYCKANGEECPDEHCIGSNFASIPLAQSLKIDLKQSTSYTPTVFSTQNRRSQVYTSPTYTSINKMMWTRRAKNITPDT